MTNQEKAYKIVESMLQNDQYSKWLGIEILRVESGSCSIGMTARQDMLNGFGIVHGGVTFAFADSAFAFASNSHGRKSVSIESSISHVVSVHAGERLYADAIEEHVSNKIAVYTVIITNQDDKRIALFKGTVFRTDKEWEV
jgi:acyl-CoA thioesterase